MNDKLKSEIQSTIDQEIIAYSMLWEDHRVLEEALQLNSDDHVLSIASAGCNVLNLLLHEPSSITAIDFNCSQLNLVRLKVAGIKVLDHSEFLELLGFIPGDPLSAFAKVATDLEPGVKAWWDGNRGLIEAGIIHQGKLEKYFQGVRKGLLQHCSPSDLDRLLDADNLVAQRQQFEQILSPAAEGFLHNYFDRDKQQEGRDTAKFKHVGHEDIAAGLLARFKASMQDTTLKDNFYNEYILFSKFRQPEQTQPYLQKKNFNRLKGLVDRLDLVNGSIEEHLCRMEAGHYSKANLSDIFEYMNPESTNKSLSIIAQKIHDQGRIAYWNLYNLRSSQDQIPGLKRELALATELHRQDRTWFYRDFVVEKVEK